jgi:hypothetical protein
MMVHSANVVSSEQTQESLPDGEHNAPAKLSKTKLKRKNHLAEKKVEKRKKFQEKQARSSCCDHALLVIHDSKSGASESDAS